MGASRLRRFFRSSKPECVYFLEGTCRFPDQENCQMCWRFRLPIRGISVLDHLVLDEYRRKRHLTLTLSILSMCVALGALALSVCDWIAKHVN